MCCTHREPCGLVTPLSYFLTLPHIPPQTSPEEPNNLPSFKLPSLRLSQVHTKQYTQAASIAEHALPGSMKFRSENPLSSKSLNDPLMAIKWHILALLLVPHDQEEGLGCHARIDFDNVVEHAFGSFQVALLNLVARDSCAEVI